ncbi:hypothetical protein ScPMuIL_018430 [Solemya velum]
MYLAILDHRNTPSQGLISSPAQHLFSRRIKTLLPTTIKLLQPEIVSDKLTKKEIKSSQDKQAKYYNKSSCDLPILEEDYHIMMKPFSLNQKANIPGKIIKRLDERSYDVQTPKGTLRRNRIYIRKTPCVDVSNNDQQKPTDVKKSRSVKSPKFSIMGRKRKAQTRTHLDQTLSPRTKRRSPAVKTATAVISKYKCGFPKITSRGQRVRNALFDIPKNKSQNQKVTIH